MSSRLAVDSSVVAAVEDCKSEVSRSALLQAVMSWFSTAVCESAGLHTHTHTHTTVITIISTVWKQFDSDQTELPGCFLIL